MLTISNLHVEVNHKEVLKGVNLSIPDHEVHALFGPNGSGKSVLISTIMGFPEYQITKGEISYKGNPLNELEINERVKLGISVLEQRPPTIKGVELGNLARMILENGPHSSASVEALAECYGMSRFFKRDINDGFSGGEIKKSELFLLILAQPDFILLDEPDSGVDPEHLRIIGQMINNSLGIELTPGEKCKPGRKKAGIIATHSAAILDFIHTDKAHIMMDGKIKCTGNPGVMMEQIREFGYAYCIDCQQNKEEA